MRRFLVIVILLLAAPAWAQDVNPNRLEDLTKAETLAREKEAALTQKRQSVQSDISKLRGDLVSVGKEAEGFEREARRLDGRLIDLDRQSEALKTSIYGDRRTLTRLLAILQRIENNPPPPLATDAEDAVEAARAARLASAVGDELKIRADRLSEQLLEMGRLRSAIEIEREKLMANEQALNIRRETIAGLVAKKSELETSISIDEAAAKARVAKLASDAQTLRDLIANFETAARSVTPRIKPGINSKPSKNRSPPTKPLNLPESVVAFSKAQSLLKAPVQGKIVRAYGKGEKGVTLSARTKAQVLSPYDGRVEFAGPFKNYDNVVIINVGEGYFILLTGLGEIFTKSGKTVSRAEPIGLMPFNTKGETKLYIEFRRDGKTIDPKPWLGTSLAKTG